MSAASERRVGNAVLQRLFDSGELVPLAHVLQRTGARAPPPAAAFAAFLRCVVRRPSPTSSFLFVCLRLSVARRAAGARVPLMRPRSETLVALPRGVRLPRARAPLLTHHETLLVRGGVS